MTLWLLSNHYVTNRGASVPPSDVGRRERALAALARRQDGAVTRAQVLALGFAPQEIKTRLAHGRLAQVYRGVYAVGPLSDHGRIRAALLATGPHTAASHDTAAWLRRLVPTLPAALHVSLTQGDRRSRPRLVVHHGLEPADVTHIAGVPVTTPLRTLEDLGWPDRLVREALAHGLCRPEDVPRGDVAENDFEDRMHALIGRAGLLQPVAQYRFGGFRLDFAWPELKVAVETDGWATHGRRAGFEDDRARDAALLAAGWRVLRLTYRRLRREPVLVAAQLAAVLAQAASASNSSVNGCSVASATGA